MCKKLGYFMMIIAVWLLSGGLVFAGTASQASAVTGGNIGKPVVAVFYVNNANTSYDNEITQKITDHFNAKLTSYDVRSGDQFIDQLNKAGINDLARAERSDIVGVFAHERRPLVHDHHRGVVIQYPFPLRQNMLLRRP